MVVEALLKFLPMHTSAGGVIGTGRCKRISRDSPDLDAKPLVIVIVPPKLDTSKNLGHQFQFQPILAQPATMIL